MLVLVIWSVSLTTRKSLKFESINECWFHVTNQVLPGDACKLRANNVRRNIIWRKKQVNPLLLQDKLRKAIPRMRTALKPITVESRSFIWISFPRGLEL